jgi:hypothetical protein
MPPSRPPRFTGKLKRELECRWPFARIPRPAHREMKPVRPQSLEFELPARLPTGGRGRGAAARGEGRGVK